jgi:hypothetical protein
MAVKKAKKAPATEKKAKKAPLKEFAPMKFKDFTITQKRSGRYEVQTSKGKNVNGPEKAKLLVEAKVLKGSFKKAAGDEAPAAT